MWGEIAGAAIGAGASLLGGSMGKDSAKKTLKEARRQYDLTRTQQIQDRVADAKKAGIHPLYAIGAGGGASPTVSAGVDNSMGNALADSGAILGNAVASASKRPSAQEAELLGLQKQQIKSNTDRNEAETILFLSEAARNIQNSNVRQESALLSAKELLDPSKPPKPTTLYTPLGKSKTGPTTKQQEYEDEYGGFVGELYGMIRWLQDQYNNAPKARAPSRKSNPRRGRFR